MTCRYDRMDNEPRATQMDTAARRMRRSRARAGRREARNSVKLRLFRRDVDVLRDEFRHAVMLVGLIAMMLLLFTTSY